jgi:hypothetical protein
VRNQLHNAALNTSAQSASGVVYIHYAPVAVCPHVEWALTTALGSPADLVWRDQAAAPGAQRAVVDWHGPVGTGARLVNALRQWPMLRFEVTEDPSPGVNGERFSYVPGIGLWHGETGANGDVILGESHLRALMEHGRRDGMWFAAQLDEALGAAWDQALEPYREGGAVAAGRARSAG